MSRGSEQVVQQQPEFPASFAGRSRMALRHLRVVAVALLAFVAAGCGVFPTQDGKGAPPRAHLTLEIQIGADGRLYKPAAEGRAAAVLERVEVTLKSGREVVRDTITTSGSRISYEPAYLHPDPSYAQSLVLRYALRPGRRWDVDVKVFDALDSVRYAGGMVVENMDDYAYLDGCLPVDPQFATIESRFRLPDFVEADGVPGSVRGLRELFFTRLTMVVDGEILLERIPHVGLAAPGDRRFRYADTNRLPGSAGVRFFRSGSDPLDAPHVVSYDYVMLNSRSFTVAAWGYIEGDTVGVTPERLLYEGARPVDINAAKVAVEEAVPMEWKAVDAVPSGDLGTRFRVTLGRAGRVIINVNIPGGVVI